jgi:hypothetical protein
MSCARCIKEHRNNLQAHFFMGHDSYLEVGTNQAQSSDIIGRPIGRVLGSCKGA